MKKKKKTHGVEIEGVLSITKYGYGFVDCDKNKGYFVSEKNMNGAFSGDTVCARLIHGKNRRECVITKIIQRGFYEVVGKYCRFSNQSFLVPLTNKINTYFKIKHVANDIPDNINEGDIIAGEILSYGEKGKYPTVYIYEHLGDKNKKGNDISIVLKKYGIREKFESDALNQNIKMSIDEKELEKRSDFTGLTVVTIDGEDAKDLDDAISVEKNENGYVLGVHIADVSHYVHSKTPIDREAYIRGTSVYLPDRVCPMLPEKLSNGVCSLNPNELKLTFSVIMYVDKGGKITDYKIGKSYIKSRARLTYEVVKDIALGNYSSKTEEYKPLYNVIHIMNELYTIMRNKRKQKGFVEFNFPETKFELSQNGKAISVFPYETSFSNEIIEEFMLAANTSVADFAMKNNLPFVYRVHEKPDVTKIKKLYDVLDALGIKRPKEAALKPNSLNKVLNEAKETPYYEAVSEIALRTMKKAVYSDTPIGHYGLNFKKYCHFTSPIRRYPDLIIHRILSEYIEGNNIKKYFKSVADIANQSTQTEITAFMAERDCCDIKKAEYMENHIGEKFSGIISGMCDTGFFVRLPNTVEGYVSLDSIKGDYYEYFEDKFIIRGKRRKDVFMIGESVEIEVKSCDVSEGKISFILKDR